MTATTGADGPRWVVCLGGRDLEMAAIAALLADRPDVRVIDRGLAWGARGAAYVDDIRAAVAAGRRVALVELADDLPADFPRDGLTWIDHHGPLAGRDVPTSLEQVFRLFGFPPDRWTRDLELVAANDRGHLPALARLGATPEEMADVRRRDRAAQGVTPAEEEQGRAAADRREERLGGRLAVVRLPHARTATVTDALAAELGGPGYENLLVLCPGATVFFGSGRCVERLRAAVPGGWWGGELPERGYWGHAGPADEVTLINAIGSGL